MMEGNVVSKLIYFEHLFFQLDPCARPSASGRPKMLRSRPTFISAM